MVKCSSYHLLYLCYRILTQCTMLRQLKFITGFIYFNRLNYFLVDFIISNKCVVTVVQIFEMVCWLMCLFVCVWDDPEMIVYHAFLVYCLFLNIRYAHLP